MISPFFAQFAIVLNTIFFFGFQEQHTQIITPNQFEGNDTQRIQAAVDKAARTTGKVVVPANNSNASGVWLLDSAVLLPGNITVILENCTIQLSDSSRDNMFRSNNVGLGITDPKWNYNTRIIGVGEVILKGADNPRSTGDSSKNLSIDCEEDKEKLKKAGGQWEYDITYGSDAGKEGRKQTGDWQNIMILMAYVDGFILKNVTIEKAHAWAVSHERVLNAEISDIRIDCPGGWDMINGKKQYVENRDGINLRNGCKNFRISNISGVAGDDFIALSILGLFDQKHVGGDINVTMVTSETWHGEEDNIERVFISDIRCKTPQWGIAIRANDMAGIHNVYVDRVFYESAGSQTFSFGDDKRILKYDNRSAVGRRNGSIYFGGRGYGRDSRPGKMNNIHAMNIIGDGGHLVNIDSRIANCSFTNGIYTGNGNRIILYRIDQSETTNIVSQNLIKAQ